MADIYLSIYETSQSINGYNAAHKYRFAKKKGLDTEQIIRIWHQQKTGVLNELVEKLNSLNNQKFFFAIAPSRTTIFVDEIKSIVSSRFENGIDISNCFIRQEGFDAGSTQSRLEDEELKNYFQLDSDCIRFHELNCESPIILLDDVYAHGNTLRGMTLALNELGINNPITTAVIIQI